MSGDGADRALTDAMLRYWSNFARTGDPNDSGLERWPAFSVRAPQVMELGTRIGAMGAPDHALCLGIAGDLYPGWAP